VIPDELQTVETWGKRLAREAERLSVRKLPPFRWALAMVPLVRRIVERPMPSPERFRRQEFVAPRLPPWPAVPELEEEPVRTQGEAPLAPAEGEAVSADIRDRLRELAGLRNEPMRLHRDDLADRIARSQRADAVTLGEHVFFRQGKFRPDEPKGLALLAHEASHIVAAMRPGASWRRATAAGLAEEESEARRREQAVLAPRPAPVGVPHPVGRRTDRPRATPSPALPQTPTVISRTFPPTVAAARPMKAETDRPAVETPAQPAVNMEELRRSLYRDILDKIRTDSERGG
jgi:hypothetical protein